MANDLLAFGEWFIIFRPFSNERSVVQPLVWPEFIVKADIRSNEMIEVLLAKDDEEIQALEFKGFPPSLNKCILIWRLRCRLLDSETDVFEHLIEFSNVHAVAVADEIVDPQISFARLLNERMSLANHPFGVVFEAAGRADYPSSANVDERQDKRVPQASRRPDHLAEEVDLPKCIDMDLEELVPGSRSTFGTWLDALFLEDVLDRRLGDTADAKLFEFSENPVVSPASFSGEADDGLSNRLQRAWPAHFFGLLAEILLTNPALIGSGMDNRNQLMGSRTDGGTELEQSFFIFGLEKDTLLGNLSAEQFVFDLVEFDLPTQLIFCRPCQIEQKRRKPTCHELTPIVTDEVEKSDDKLFALLESTIGRPR